MREKKCDRMIRELREKLGDKYRIIQKTGLDHH